MDSRDTYARVVHGDCLPVMRTISSNSVDLVYMDPPFFTGKEQRSRGRRQWQGEQLAFSDIWGTYSKYLEWMRQRLIEVHRLLKDSGAVFLHCDWHANHLLRVELDEIFHPDQFRAEIIWVYKRWTNSLRAFQRSHETLFFYSKSDRYQFNILFEDYSFTTNIDQIWQKRGRGVDGRAVTLGDGNGGYVPLGKDKPGVPMRDVWEIPYLNPKARERVGYPTQKPVELLKRVIQATTEPGDLVLDPFCGSGTTLVAAKFLARNSIGIDTSAEAVTISEERLRNSDVAGSSKHDVPYKLGKFLELTRDEKVRVLARRLQFNIAQRNRYIDGFLKRNIKESAVSVRYTGTELNPEAIDGFVHASTKRLCSIGLIVVDQASQEDSRKVGSNSQSDFQIVLVSYEELCHSNWTAERLRNDLQASLPIG